MDGLFALLSGAVEGAPLVALGAALAWGVLSIVLSPCHLASLPLIVGFIQGQDNPTPRRAALLATLFAAGILLTIAALGAVTAAAGRLLGDVGTAGNVLVAGVFLVTGLVFLDLIPLPAPRGTRFARQGAVAAFVLGLVFGIALGPCTFAFLAPVMAVAFRAAADDAAFGALLLLAYGIGHCLVIVAAGSSAAWAQRVLDWNAGSGAGRLLKRACGVLIILAGFYLLSTAH